MLKDITLGQYFPGNTVVHRLDPRTKLLLSIAYVGALFTVRSWTGYAFMAAVYLSVVMITSINTRTIIKSMKPIVTVIVFTAVLNIFFTQGTPIVHFGVINITREGIILAVQMTLRFVLLLSGTFMLTYTTSPLALTDAIESLLGPLKRVRFPVHALAMMMSIALRFVPTLIEETDKIMSAQKARGADFETGGVIKRAKALLPILVPLFVSAIRRAEELAEAMESRCYNGGEGRTRMKQLVFRRADVVALVCGVLTVAAVVALNLLP